MASSVIFSKQLLKNSIKSSNILKNSSTRTNIFATQLINRLSNATVSVLNDQKINQVIKSSKNFKF
jgi:hypothetical protein